MTRLLRNTNSPVLFRYYKNKLIKRFVRRDYPKRILDELHRMTYSMRLEALHRTKRRIPMDKPLPFITEYAQYRPPLNKIFHKRWTNIYGDPKFYSLLPNAPFTVFRNKKALLGLLSAKRRKWDTKRYLPDLNLENEESFHSTKFNQHRTGIRATLLA